MNRRALIAKSFAALVLGLVPSHPSRTVAGQESPTSWHTYDEHRGWVSHAQIMREQALMANGSAPNPEALS